MRLGVVFPQTESGTDPAAIRDYVQAVEALGYDHLAAFDHVLGADLAHWNLTNAPYSYETLFHEPMVFFGYAAALTTRLELVTSILILPQRQTALVAKQAAEIDVLSGGRFRLGVGVGWNPAEYAALGEDFHRRGRRSEEQIALMRALWAEQLVDFDGKYDHVARAGINPLPVRRSIPVWLGGMSDAVIERVGRMADGWFPQYRNPSHLAPAIERVRTAAARAGRDPTAIGFEARVQVSSDGAVEHARQFEAAGATHVAVNTMGAGFASLNDHIEALRRFAGDFGPH